MKSSSRGTRKLPDAGRRRLSAAALLPAAGALVLLLLSACATRPRLLPSADVLESGRPSVVRVDVVARLKECRVHLVDPVSADYFGAPPIDGCIGSGVGSGVIVDDAGLVVTNNHVVADAVSVAVELSDGRHERAVVVGSDSVTDLALLRLLSAARESPARFSTPARLRVGDRVFAIGAPFGLGLTATSGIVSAIPDEDDERGFLQTDAALNPGNSGGPLFDERGDVVGINVAILSEARGVGFAIPAERVRRVIASLRSRGRVTRGTIGVEVQTLTRDLAMALGLDAAAGALVARVESGSAAERSGLERGDVIVAIGGEAVSSARDVVKRVTEASPGMTLRLRLRRGTDLREAPAVEVTEAAAPPLAAAPAPVPGHELGFGVTTLTPDLARRLGMRDANASGVLVVSVRPDSGAYSAGLREGDVIIEVDRQSINNVETFRSHVEPTLAANDGFLLLVRRGASTRFVSVRPSSS